MSMWRIWRTGTKNYNSRRPRDAFFSPENVDLVMERTRRRDRTGNGEGGSEGGREAPRPRARRVRVALLVLAAIALLLARPVVHHAKAARLLVTFADASAAPPADVLEERIEVEVPGAEGRSARRVPARVFSPRGAEHAPAIVLVHGVHFKGIEEPRLVRFARAVAGAGLVVMTPEVAELSAYAVAPPAIETVGASVAALSARVDRPRVGLMGMSFGGGLSLIAAADPRFADKVSFVVAVGAHDDLARVSRFFVRNRVELVDGGERDAKAHDYGAVVLLASHAEDFFPPEDAPRARACFHAWLKEDRAGARAMAQDLGPASREKVTRVFDGDLGPFKEEILAVVARREKEMRRVSPGGRLEGLRAPTFLLHGAGDTVIPPSETDWLAHHVPPSQLEAVLVSPAIVHVEVEHPTAYQQFELVHFMGSVLAAADAS